jgi:NADH-quinone oxidoreductase subunit E
MSRYTQGSQTIVGAITAAIFLVALVALMVLGDYGFLPALFLSLLIALLSGIVLYLGFGGAGGDVMAAPAPKPAPKASSAPKPAPAAPAAAPAPAPAPAPKAEQPIVAGLRPKGLDGPRGGTPDDLKLIKGIGPKLEKLCNSLGFWHFDQIAAWTPEEVAWVDENLQGFKGRVSRDNWIEQAKRLAEGS